MKTTHVRGPDAKRIHQASASFRIPWRAAVRAHAAPSQALLYEIRWRTDGTLHKARRRTRALAEALRSGIQPAAENGLSESLRSVCA